MIRPPLGVLPLSLLVSGCLTSGGNIKGDFDCRAPGGTCAPMTSIDAAAVAGIGGVRPMSAPMGAPLNTLPSDRAAPLRQASVPGIEDGTAPPRTSDWVLRVVFPAHIDGDGVYREESAAHAVVESSAWAASMGAPSYRPRTVPALRASGVVAGAPASASAAAPVEPQPTSALATLDEIVAARAAKAHGQPFSGSAGALPAPSRPPSETLPAPVTGPVPTAQTMPSPFSGFALSRATVPTTLAEAAAGFSAPPVKSLDPLNPSANYDTPDVASVRTASAPAGRYPSRAAAMAASRSVPAYAGTDSLTSTAAAPSAAPPRTGAAPYGSRTVRWKGRRYELAYKNPQSAGVSSAPPSMTADLNRSSLAKADAAARENKAIGSPEREGATAAPTAVPAAGPVAMAPVVPRFAPTDDAAVAAARVRAMAAPILADAAESGRAEARRTAPQGFSLPLPLSPVVPK